MTVFFRLENDRVNVTMVFNHKKESTVSRMSTALLFRTCASDSVQRREGGEGGDGEDNWAAIYLKTENLPSCSSACQQSALLKAANTPSLPLQYGSTFTTRIASWSPEVLKLKIV